MDANRELAHQIMVEAYDWIKEIQDNYESTGIYADESLMLLEDIIDSLEQARGIIKNELGK